MARFGLGWPEIVLIVAVVSIVALGLILWWLRRENRRWEEKLLERQPESPIG